MYSQIQEEAAEAGAAGDGAPDTQDVVPAEAPRPEKAGPVAVRPPTAIESLKSEIARAMQVAADLERERIDAGVGDQESAQVEKVFTRAAAEAAELSKQADEDVSLVNTWYKDQIKRLRADADRQIDDRRAGLEQSLTQHGSLIEAEIESVHLAVEGYRASLRAFFGRMAEERDPSAIARLAGDLPDPPDLDEVRAEARSAAMEALEQDFPAESSGPSDEGSADGNGRTGGSGGPGLERELVPVMDEDAIKERAGSLSGTTNAVATPVPAALSAGEPSSTPERPDVDVTGSTPEAPAAHGNVAIRVIRAFTNRSTRTAAPHR